MLPAKIKAYNAPGVYTAAYNRQYNHYVVARAAGIAAFGSLGAWIAGGRAAPAIWKLLDAFGMNAQNSALVPVHSLQATLTGINPATTNWVAAFTLPLGSPPAALVSAATGATLAAELRIIHDLLAAPGSVTASGGYVAASKAMHCLFPELAPMIDGRHTGLSYYHIVRPTYTPPLKLTNWAWWLGAPMIGTPNPSPRGGGRTSWGWHQFMAAVGINQHIYELWQAANLHPGLAAFLALHPTPGTTGIPRIIDKGLW